jgi:phage terminase Nu1 subunit (DNA packaging protein)
MDENGSDRTLSEDELARQMIARIARQVDLETGRVPLEPTQESEEVTQPEVDEPSVELVAAPAEASEEDISRQLVERIAREVDEEPHG